MSALTDAKSAYFRPVRHRPRAVTAPSLIASVLPVTEQFAALLASAWITNDWKLHAPCSTTFCRNPLHPGPCKGWKHTLKKVAPGAYDALEKARIEKLEAKRKAKIKELQDAGKKIPKHLTKPIKSIEPKPGPVNIEPNQPPLSAETEKKLAEVSAKTKKAFQGPTPEEKGKIGADVASAYAEAAISKKLTDQQKTTLAKQLMGVHASGDDKVLDTLSDGYIKNLDGKTKVYTGKNLTPEQKNALKQEAMNGLKGNGDGSTPELDKVRESWKAKLAEDESVPVKAPAESTGPKPTKADAEKLTLKQAGLQPGDKVWLHTHNGGGSIDFGPKAKAGDKPVLVEVKAEKNAHYGMAKGTVSYGLHGADDGQFINGGSAAAKYWISPVGGGKFSEVNAPEVKAPQVSAPEEPKSTNITEKANAAANMAFAPSNFSKAERLDAYGELNQDDVDSLNTQDTANLIDDLNGLEASGLTPGQQKIVNKVKDHIEKQGPEGEAMATAHTGGEPTGEAKLSMDLINNTSTKGSSSDIAKKTAGATGMTKEDFDSLSEQDKKQVNDVLAKVATPGIWGSSKADQDLAKAKYKEYNGVALNTAQGSDVHAKPASSVNPDTVGIPPVSSHGATQAEKDLFADVTNNSHKYSYDQILGAYQALNADDFNKIDLATRISAADKLKALANNPALSETQRAQAISIATKLGSTQVMGTKNQFELAKAVQTGGLDEISQAANFLSKEEYTGLPIAQKAAIKKTIKDLFKTGLDDDDQLGQELAHKLLGGPPPKPKTPPPPSATPPVPAPIPSVSGPDVTPTPAPSGPAPDTSINPPAKKPGDPQSLLQDWITKKKQVVQIPKTSIAGKIADSIKWDYEGTRLVKYKDLLDKKKFDNLPEATQEAIIADLDRIASDSTVFGEYHQTKAVDLRKLFTGADPLTLFTPSKPAPKKPAAAKKVDLTPTGQLAYDTVDSVGNGKPLDRLKVYQGLTKDEFENLPATTQKELIKDLGNMAYASGYGYNNEYKDDFGKGYLNVNKQAAKDLLLALIGKDTAKGFKPKTKAQKEYEKLGDSMFTPGDGSSGTLTSANYDVYKKKLSVAAKSAQALNVPAADLTNTGDGWAKFATPEYTGSDMVGAIGDYKGSGYRPMNVGLRVAKGDLDAYAKWDGEDKQHYHTYSAERVQSALDEIKAMDALMKQTRLEAPIQTLRGFGTPWDVFGTDIWNNGKTDLTGLEWTEHGWSSTTTSPQIARNFAGAGPKTDGKVMTEAEHGYAYTHAKDRVIMRIFTPKGVGAVKLSGPEYEYEVLLDRGIRYRVVKDRGVIDGARQLDVEVIQVGANG